MLLSFFWAFLAVFSGVVSATTAAELELITKATALYPPCALKCMTQLVPQSSCSLTDVQCLCTNKQLTDDTSKCVLAGCTIQEGLTTQNVTMTMCGAPVRDKHMTPLVISITGGTLATLAFAMRVGTLLTRTNGRSVGADDWLAGIALLLAAPPTLVALQMRDNGLGKDIWTLKVDQIQNILLFFYLGSIFYIASITAVKLSIICFILRVFPDKNFRRLCYAVMGLVLAYGISFVTATALQCWPASYAWTQIDSSIEGSCNNVHLQAWLAAACNIFLDLLLLVLPLSNLWKLNMGVKKKIMIMFMFSLGIFVTIVSVIRLHSLITFANSTNVTWDYAEPGYWSLIEMDVSIICACLPYCRHLLISLGARFLQSTQQRSATYGGSSRPTFSRKNSEGGILGSSMASKSTKSTGGGDGGVPQQRVPKHGDEGDFVPLVEYPHGNWDKTTSVTTTHATTASRGSD